MTNEEFIEILEKKKYTYKLKDECVVVTKKGTVWLEDLTKLPEGTRFQNGGNLYLPNLKTLPKEVRFEYPRHVFLHEITDLPEGIKFENRGYTYLPKLEGTHRYRGRDIEFKTINDHTMIIESRQYVDDYEILRVKAFKGGPIEDISSFYMCIIRGYGHTTEAAIDHVKSKLTN